MSNIKPGTKCKLTRENRDFGGVEMEKIEFIAYLPPIQSALNIGGEEGASQ